MFMLSDTYARPLTFAYHFGASGAQMQQATTIMPTNSCTIVYAHRRRRRHFGERMCEVTQCGGVCVCVSIYVFDVLALLGPITSPRGQRPQHTHSHTTRMCVRCLHIRMHLTGNLNNCLCALAPYGGGTGAERVEGDDHSAIMKMGTCVCVCGDVRRRQARHIKHQ